MIDAREPKDGDYARYLEELVNAPKAPENAPTPTLQDIARDARATGPLPRQPRAASTERQPGAARQSPAATGELAHVLLRVARITSFIGVALILLSLTDIAPFFADPAFGMLLLVAGIFVNRFARKLR